MSCYLVENETIDRIISYLEHENHGIDSAGGINIQKMSVEEKQSFGNELLKMNCESMIAIYGQAEEEDLLSESYQISFRLVDIMQAFKSFQCFLYQCSEGKCPESSLYRKIERVKNHIASQIISNLPEYQKAIWG